MRNAEHRTPRPRGLEKQTTLIGMYRQLMGESGLWSRLKEFYLSLERAEKDPSAKGNDIWQRAKKVGVDVRLSRIKGDIIELGKGIAYCKAYLEVREDKIGYKVPETERGMRVENDTMAKGRLEDSYEQAWNLWDEIVALKKALETVDFTQPSRQEQRYLSLEDLARGKGGGRSEIGD